MYHDITSFPGSPTPEYESELYILCSGEPGNEAAPDIPIQAAKCLYKLKLYLMEKTKLEIHMRIVCLTQKNIQLDIHCNHV